MTDKPKLTVEEINELLEKTRDQKFRKMTQGQIDGINIRAESARGKKKPEHSAKLKGKAFYDPTGIPNSPECNSKISRSLMGHSVSDAQKELVSRKSKIRQELKRQYNLGMRDSVPKDLLQEAYKKAGLI